MKTLKVVLGAFVLVATMVAFEDIPQLNALLQKLQSYNSKYPSEKIYMHLDKPFYKPGETIWFSVYAVHGVTHKPSVISNTVIVQLIDPKGNVVNQPEVYIRWCWVRRRSVGHRNARWHV
ncbi:MAG TPA: hypothetical protein VFE50_21600 [Cyclobacteriaceae bacterium]|nr:hypothetical protein [Cyclobacteriaceae bacterium]